VNERVGSFVNWRLNIWGESINGSHQPLHPFPGMTEELGAEAGIIATARIETSAESHTPSPAFMNLSVNEEFSDAKPMSAHWIYRWVPHASLQSNPCH
jgi:kexin